MTEVCFFLCVLCTIKSSYPISLCTRLDLFLLRMQRTTGAASYLLLLIIEKLPSIKPYLPCLHRGESYGGATLLLL